MPLRHLLVEDEGVRGDRRPLPALDASTYARGHALFEGRSDQRGKIVAWLGERLAERAAAPALSVLSVGCGDGSVDVELAERACASAEAGSVRSWTGVDPHPASAAAFRRRLSDLRRTELSVHSHACTFADLDVARGFDVITFVHSLYYVGDVRDTLARALDLLAPGGELLVLHAPLSALNELTAALAPAVAGHHQSWSAAVADELALLPVRVQRTEIEARVDLDGCATADPALLDFTVQVSLDDLARREVVAALRSMTEPGGGMRVAHPVTAFSVRPD